MMLHESPACAPSRVRNSKRPRSSCTGTPHSSSWYRRIRGSSPAHAQTRLLDAFMPGISPLASTVTRTGAYQDSRTVHAPDTGIERYQGPEFPQPANRLGRTIEEHLESVIAKPRSNPRAPLP